MVDLLEVLRKNKNYVIIGVIAVMVIITVLTIGKSVKNEKVDATGYIPIDDVPGCEFMIQKEYSESASVVNEISKNIDFLDYETYKFRNGSDLFVIFNMQRYICIVKKGTTFNLSTLKPEDSFAENSLQGIWFEPLTKVQKSGNTYSLDVTAQVTITNTLYNDFTGKLITIEQDGEEWAMFTGYVHAEDEDSIEMAKVVSSTLVAKSIEVEQMEDFTVDIETAQIIASNDPVEEISEEPASSSTQEPPQEPGSEEKPSEDTSTPQPSSEQSQPEPTAPKEESDTFEASSTQREIVADENTAYSSSKYSMLPIQSIGYMDIYNEDTKSKEAAFIKVTKVYTEDETKEILREYSENTGNTYYESLECPEGCHYEAASYDVRYTSTSKSILSIKLLGVDGETLRYRGIPYSSKTHILTGELTESNDWYSGNIVFYAVPNGCFDYSLCCGGIVSSNEDRPAWIVLSTR